MPAWLIAPLIKIVSGLAILGALYLGVIAWGNSRHAEGVKEERAKWETAAEIERARQQAARAAIEQLGAKIAADISNKIAGLEPMLKDLADDAATETAQPAPTPAPGCPDTYRGIAPGSLLKLEAVR